MCKKRLNLPYSDHIETIVALTTHLAMTRHKSRTPRILSDDLSLNYDEVLFVLKNFKGLFRPSNSISKKSKEPDGSPEHFYWLHLRYARWYLEGRTEDDETPEPPLEPEYLVSLLNFVTKMVEQEQLSKRQYRSNTITLIASIVALVASIIAASISIL